MRAYTRVPVGPSWSTILPDMDFEAYSEAGYYWDGPANRWRGVTKTNPGIAAVGAPAYTEHPSTEILSLAYDLKDGLGARMWIPGMSPPVELFDHIVGGGLLEAWNSAFEYHLWLNVCHARMGWPALPPRQLRCAMSKARAFSLPGALKDAARVVGASEQKDTRGDALIRKLCIPRSPTNTQVARCADPRHANRLTPNTAPQEFGELFSYNLQDIRAEAAVSLLCPDLSDKELALWLLDQQVNFRGIAIDRKALADCIDVVNQADTKYTGELRAITGGAVQSAGELKKMGDWLKENGVHTVNLDADAVAAALKKPNLPPACRRVLEIRDSLGAASVKKLFSIDRRLSRDGRLRDLLAFCGADRTGRWAGRGPQPQNLPSSGPKVVRCSAPGCGRVYWKGLAACPVCGGPSGDCDWGIDAVDAALADIATRNLAYVESQWGDAVAAVSGCLRGLFSAEPGRDLICSDFSAIEAVVLAELAGEAWRQEVFRTHGKIYEMSASKISGVPFNEFQAYKKKHGVHHPLRKKIGKVAELASGYGGGLGAWKAFGADDFMNDDEITANVKAWRQASPQVVAFWYGLQQAAMYAVQSPGYCYRYQAAPTPFGAPPAIAYGVKDDILYCQLPSGRMLTYHAPLLESCVGYNGRTDLRLTYMGTDSYTKQWTRLDTWGGKLTENVVQAVARDILADRLPPLEDAGYPIVLHVHDEIVAEVPAGAGSVKEFELIMSTMPEWAAGWPVKAAGGWRGLRYRKD